MKEINPKMIKIIRYQERMIFINAIVASVVSIYFSLEFFDSLLISFFAAMVGSFLISKILSSISLQLLQLVYYGANVAQMKKDAGDVVDLIANGHHAPTQNEIKIKIVSTSPQILGSFMDTQFHEWIEVEDPDGKILKFHFSGTMDISNGLSFQIPDGGLLLPPGILYQVEPV